MKTEKYKIRNGQTEKQRRFFQMRYYYSLKFFVSFYLILLCAVFVMGASENAYIIKDGKAMADIVIAGNPPRMTKFAASELQDILFKITGAKLPIQEKPDEKYPVHIYIGKSSYTDKMGVNDADLENGAFRILSCKDYLVLLGKDTNFVPKEPWIHDYKDKERALKDWDKLTGGAGWYIPNDWLSAEHSAKFDLWEKDEHGSFNAVNEFLRGLGCRWYLPGKLGEVLPEMTSISLQEINKTVRPDFPYRDFLFYYNTFRQASEEEIKWQLRLGLNQQKVGIGGAHGLAPITCRKEMKKEHPEYYALYNGKRDNAFAGRNIFLGAQCLSSEGLFQETLKYIYFMYDKWGSSIVGVAPSDSYFLCQCELCKGKGTPERGWQGELSDYVFGYVNKVAKEVYKTHPGCWINTVAYGQFVLPPEKIKTMSPNVIVGFCYARTWLLNPGLRRLWLDARKNWLEKLPSKKIWVYDYHRYQVEQSPYRGVPVYFPHIIAEDLRSLKGISLGDYIEIYRTRTGDKFDALAADHLNVYVNARFLWDTDQNLDALLDDYYEKFYGPAKKEMKAFIEYAEANWMTAVKDTTVLDRLFALLNDAQKTAGDTVYGKRIALLVPLMEPLKKLRERLAQNRNNNPKARALGRNKADIQLDGKLDDKFWEKLPVYELCDIITAEAPYCRTIFQMAWADNSLYLGIKCYDRHGKAYKDNTDIFKGDTVEIMLETQTHQYYQIVVNPKGRMFEADRNGGAINSLWSSGAKTAAYIGDGFWSVELCIPTAGEGQAQIDPLHGVDGRRPINVFSWHFNVCRNRISEKGNELSAFSPVGKPDFHDTAKFAELTTW